VSLARPRLDIPLEEEDRQPKLAPGPEREPTPPAQRYGPAASVAASAVGRMCEVDHADAVRDPKSLAGAFNARAVAGEGCR
jgi:hypothetical protein